MKLSRRKTSSIYTSINACDMPKLSTKAGTSQS